MRATSVENIAGIRENNHQRFKSTFPTLCQEKSSPNCLLVPPVMCEGGTKILTSIILDAPTKAKVT